MADDSKKNIAWEYDEIRKAGEDYKQIVIDTGKIDPSSISYLTDENGEPIPNPEFDPKTMEINPEQMALVKERLAYLASDALGISQESQEKFQAALTIFSGALSQAVKGLGTFLTDTKTRGVIEAAMKFVKEMQPLIEDLEQWEKQQPYIEAELKKPQYGGKTFDEIAEEGSTDLNDNNGVIPGSLFEQLLNNSYSAMLEADRANTERNSLYSPIVRPKSYAIPNSKPVNKYLELQDLLTRIDTDGQLSFVQVDDSEGSVEVVAKHETKNAPAVIDILSLSYNGDLDGKAAKIKGYDQSIYNGISSLYQAGNRVFLLEDLYKVITQKDKATDAQLNRTEKSLEKLAATRIRLDMTEEIKRNMISPELNGEKIVNGVLDEALLNYKSFTVTTERGVTKTAIKIMDEPALYYYSRLKKQIITIPVEYLEMKVKATPETIAIRDYLLREINQMKKGFRDNNNIKYESLLYHAGIDEESLSRTEKGRITATTCEILNNLRDKQYIKDYKVNNGAHNKTLGFKIFLPTE